MNCFFHDTLNFFGCQVVHPTPFGVLFIPFDSKTTVFILIDYTELPDSGKVQLETENLGLMDEDELVAKGYQLTDTGWVKA